MVYSLMARMIVPGIHTEGTEEHRENMFFLIQIVILLFWFIKKSNLFPCLV